MNHTVQPMPWDNPWKRTWIISTWTFRSTIMYVIYTLHISIHIRYINRIDTHWRCTLLPMLVLTRPILMNPHGSSAQRFVLKPRVPAAELWHIQNAEISEATEGSHPAWQGGIEELCVFFCSALLRSRSISSVLNRCRAHINLLPDIRLSATLVYLGLSDESISQTHVGHQ